MEANLSSFQGLYGSECGALLYLLPTQINIQEQGAYDELKKALKKLAECPSHNEMRAYVCLEQTCPLKGLICSKCMLEFHKIHFPKLFPIEKVAHFLQKNEEILRENEEDNGEMVKKILEQDSVLVLFGDFFSNLTKYYRESLEKIQTKHVEKVKVILDEGYFKNGEEGLSERLGLIGSLTIYNENFMLDRMIGLQESKNKLAERMDFFKEHLTKEMEAFQDKIKAVIDVIFNMKTEMSLEKYQEIVDHKQPKSEFEEMKENEQDVEEEISHSIIRKAQNLPSKQKFEKRLPHLPSRIESYWPVTCDKTEKIKFTPLRESVQLLGFTQLKIVHFENRVAKFRIKLYETEVESQYLEPEIMRITSSKEKQQESTLRVQEIQIEPDKNQESNFILFDEPVLMKMGREYVLELAAVKNYSFNCKYGLKNQRSLQSQYDNDILKFLPAHDEFELLRMKSYEEFVTDEAQGLFPSLIYEIVPKKSSIFDFSSC